MLFVACSDEFTGFHSSNDEGHSRSQSQKSGNSRTATPNQTESETTAVSSAAEEKDEAKKGEPAPTRKKTKRGE